MKYPGTFLARQSGYIAFFLVYNNILETRSHISFLVSFLHFPKTTYPSYSALDEESRDVVSELLLVWMVPQSVHGRRRGLLWVAAAMDRWCPSFWVGATPIPKLGDWLKQYRLDSSLHLPPCPQAFAQCTKRTPVLTSVVGLWCSTAISKLCDFMCLDLGFLSANRALHLGPGYLGWSPTSSS